MAVYNRAKDIKRIAVIGAGMMGFGIGLEFARFGYDVALYNTRQATSDKAMEKARQDLDLMVETKLLAAAEADAAYARLHPTTDFVEAATGADYVIESVLEQLELKQNVFTRLDEICPPPTILATNASNIKVSDIAAKTRHPERTVVTHYFGPPHFIPLVEVVKGERTDPQVVETTAQLLRGLRKKVVVLNIELPSHVGNRLQMAMFWEIHSLVDKGIPPTDIDEIITFGFGRRLPLIGYFQRMDMVGLDGRLDRYKAAGQKPWAPIVEHVKRGELGQKSGKGFYDWPPGSAEQLDRRLNLELIRQMKRDMDEGLI